MKETASLTKIVVVAQHACKWVKLKNVAKCAVKLAQEARHAKKWTMTSIASARSGLSTSMASVSTRDPAVKYAQETRHAKKWTMTTNAVVETASLTKIVVLALRARKPITFKNVAKCAVKFAPEAQLANSTLESGGVLASMG